MAYRCTEAPNGCPLGTPKCGECLPVDERGAVDIARLPHCPECHQGKHRNCLGDAWDTARNTITACGCYVSAPREHTAIPQ